MERCNIRERPIGMDVKVVVSSPLAMNDDPLSCKATLKVSLKSAVLPIKVDEDRQKTNSQQPEVAHSFLPSALYSSVPAISIGSTPPPTNSQPPPKRPQGKARVFASVLGFGLALALSALSANTVSVEETSHGANTQQVPVQQRWNKHEVEVILDSSLHPLSPHIKHIVESAFGTWSNTGAALPTLRFVQGHGAVASLEPDGKSTVLVAPITFPGHESDLAITIGFSNPQTGEVSEADIVINAAHVFSSVPERAVEASGRLAGSLYTPIDQESCAGSLDSRGCDSSYDLQNVLTHEAGHFFGLGENYDDTRATMFSCTSACETHKQDLAHSDAENIVALYASRTEPVAAGCSGVQIGGDGTRSRLGLFTGWLLLGLFAWSRRRLASRC